MAKASSGRSSASASTSASARRPAGNGGKPASKSATATATTRKPVDLDSMTDEQKVRYLVKKLTRAIDTKFKVTLPMREERQQLKTAHAFRELFGLDINAKLKKLGKSLKWDEYNRLMESVFGKPDNSKFPADVMAAVAAQFFEWLDTDPSVAVDQMVEYNRESLKRRNEREKAEEAELENLDEDEEFEEEEVVDLDDEDESEEDESDESDDDEFEDDE